MSFRLIVFGIFPSLLLICSGCGSQDAGTGSAEIHWPDCWPGTFDTGRVTVSHNGKVLVAKSFDCDISTGTVKDIPAGENRTFVVELLFETRVTYRGTKTGVTVIKNETIVIDGVEMEPVYENDVYPPAKVEDLAGQADGSDIILTWTATGDDGMLGRSAYYDLRWSVEAIQDNNFDQANQVIGTPAPIVAGATETFKVTGLDPGGTYHFALKVVDDNGNMSKMSNEAIVSR